MHISLTSQDDQSAFAPQNDFVASLTAALDQQNDTRNNDTRNDSTFLPNDLAAGGGARTDNGPLSATGGGGGEGRREQGSSGKLSPSQMESILTPPSKSSPTITNPTSPAPEEKARRPSLIPSPSGGKTSPAGGKSRETSPSTSQDDRKTPSKWHTREVL